MRIADLEYRSNENLTRFHNRPGIGKVFTYSGGQDYYVIVGKEAEGKLCLLDTRSGRLGAWVQVSDSYWLSEDELNRLLATTGHQNYGGAWTLCGDLRTTHFPWGKAK